MMLLLLMSEALVEGVWFSADAFVSLLWNQEERLASL